MLRQDLPIQLEYEALPSTRLLTRQILFAAVSGSTSILRMLAVDFALPVKEMRNMPATHHPTIGDAVLFEFTVASAYALLIVIGTGTPDTFFGMAVEKWIDIFVPAVRVLFALVPVPDGVAESAHSDAVRVYRHILAACILIACGHFVHSRRHWGIWSERIKSRLSAVSGSPESRVSTALLGFQRMILGFVAALLLALFVEAQVPAIGDYLFRAGWTYVRAPLLLAAAYSFACQAAALRIFLTGLR